MIFNKLKHSIRNNPSLFQLFWKRQESAAFKRRVVRNKDDLVIEGFPRSGNTFAIYAFRAAQNFDLKIGNHFHSPAQFLLAQKYNMPALLLIRNPKDAVVSLAIYHSHANLKKHLLAYIHFHKPLVKISNSFVTAKFEDVISDMGAITEKINIHFKSDYIVPNHTQDFSDGVIKEIEEDRIRRLKIFGDQNSSELRATIPSDKKNQRKIQLLELIESPQYESLLSSANALYNTILDKHTH